MIFPLIAIAAIGATLATPTSFDPICILGAGPSGLQAVASLNAKGYENIKVLEVLAQPGGKAAVYVDNQGNRFRTGAVLGERQSYIQTLALMKEFSVDATILAPVSIIVYQSETGISINPATQAAANTTEINAAFQTYVDLYAKYESYLVPGYTNGIPEELLAPLGDFINANNLQALLPAFYFTLNAEGYGSLTETATIYFLSGLHPNYIGSPMGIATAGSNVFSPDYNELFVKMAASVTADFTYNAVISKVTRPTEGSSSITYTVGSSKSVQQCSSIIVAFPQRLDKLSFFDLDRQEIEVFKPVSTVQYFTAIVDYAFVMPTNSLYLDMLNFVFAWPPVGLSQPQGYGQPVMFRNQVEGSKLATVYSWADTSVSVSLSFVNALTVTVLDLVGKTFGTKVLESTKWDYFPHVTKEELSSGWFTKFNNLQGHRNTFYTGGIAQFEIIERALTSSIALVEKYF